MRAIVDLIGDDDPTIRMNASEFLMKIDDAPTVTKVRAELEAAIERRGSPGVPDNKVYYAAVVLGTWARILPDSQKEVRQSIKTSLLAARNRMGQEGKWKNTVTVIDNLLALARES